MANSGHIHREKEESITLEICFEFTHLLRAVQEGYGDSIKKGSYPCSRLAKNGCRPYSVMIKQKELFRGLMFKVPSKFSDHDYVFLLRLHIRG